MHSLRSLRATAPDAVDRALWKGCASAGHSRNGIVERLHRTLLDEHFRVERRKTWFETIDEMQIVLDDYLIGYNTRRPHQGRGMNGRTPQAFIDGIRKKETPQPKLTQNAA